MLAGAYLRLIRVFVSSPGDCSAEREALEEVVERINQSELSRGFVLRTFAWGRDVVPQIGPAPQPVVDAQTPICDVYLGIMSARFGGDGTRESGTELELRQALTRFGDTGQPWILFYFNDEPPLPRTPAASQDWTRVLEFRAQLEQKGIVGSYCEVRGSSKGFFEQVELHLRALLQRPELMARVQTSVPSRAASESAKHSKPAIPAAYISWLQAQCGRVDLFGLEPKFGSAARLESIYVPLTTTPGEREAKKKLKPGRDVDMSGRERPTLLLERLARESLYVSGAPGSGKSTFGRWVMWLTCAGSLPSSSRVAAPDEYRESWPEAFAGRLPLLVRLRECWHDLPVREGALVCGPKELEQAIAAHAARTMRELERETVLAHLHAGTTLLVLDGVDEVPVAQGEGGARWYPRAVLLSALTNAREGWIAAGNRLLVTSRPYGLSAAEANALGLPPAPLQDLDEPLQQFLIGRWFQQLRPGDKGQEYANGLTAHLREHRWLEPLAVNPLLLTGMCIVFEGGRLPQDKHQLYTRLVETVLHSRYHDDRSELDKALYHLRALAYAMHTGDSLVEMRPSPIFETTHREIDRVLKASGDSRIKAIDVREELLSRSGLLIGSGDGTARFCHASFQEFLAGERIADLVDDLAPVFIERADTPEWHYTLSLLFAGQSPERAARIVTRMVEHFPAHGPRLQEVAADCIDILLARDSRLEAATEEMCRQAFLTTMTSSAPAVLRCRVGSTLGRLGDPRFDPDHWYLPRETEAPLGFLRVPAGPFLMGSDPARDRDAGTDEQPQHGVALDDYYVARYPVTVVQFAAFVDASGYEPAGEGSRRGVPNHPVVYVTWHDALAYSDWLTGVLRDWHDAPPEVDTWLAATLRQGWRVTLPSEAEWEKAARGTDGRIYPWGDQFDAMRGNFGKTNLGTLSPVGAFPSGASPCGALDISGNAMAWTRTLWGADSSRPKAYPYRPGDRTREDLAAQSLATRMVRGVSFSGSWTFWAMGPGMLKARAAHRIGVPPSDVHGEIGFRLVVTKQAAGNRKSAQ